MFPVAMITFLEGLRSRVLYGIFIFSLFVMGMSIVFSRFFMQQTGKVIVDFNLSAISFAGLLISLSVSVNLIHKDLDKKTIYFVISRPISRSGYILGKYLGLMLIVFISFLLLATISSMGILLMKWQMEGGFAGFRWLAYFQAIYFDFLKYGLFNAVIVFFGSICSSSFLTMLFSLSIYIIGQTTTEVTNFLSVKISSTEISPWIHNVIDFVRYLVPNLSLFDFKVVSAHGMLLSFFDFITFTSYGLIYSVLLLIFASIIFAKKEIL